jgi:hypothetical protein
MMLTNLAFNALHCKYNVRHDLFELDKIYVHVHELLLAVIV